MLRGTNRRGRLSNKSLETALAPIITNSELNRKIGLATECFTTTKASELILKDRTRLSEENALTVCNYIIAFKHEVNPRPSYIHSTIQFLSELSKAVGVEKRFEDFTKDDILLYLDSYRKPENEDPMHKWIGTYNLKLVTLVRFFKWLYYPNVSSPKQRNQLAASERKPDCIQGIAHLKRKEISCYKPTDLWTQEDDLLFLKWVTNKRDRCYHTMSRDTSCRPHELLALKIKDIVFKNVDRYQYAEVVVNGKTGNRPIPLIQSLPYIKDWLANHPSRNNPNSPVFVGLGKYSMGRRGLTISGLGQIYTYYQREFFPKLLEDPAIPIEDKDKIKNNLLTKPFSPYIRRHSSLTEKARKLKTSTLEQHAGWVPGSNMQKRYVHYFGNESSIDILEAYGIKTSDNVPINTLNPKICPNCGEGNTQDARFCSECKMIMSFEGYQEALESQKQKENEIKKIQEQFKMMQSAQNEILEMLKEPDKLLALLKRDK
jgi:integrase/recombinase XerD